MFKLTVLPKWIFTGTIPSVYDTESGTCIEMTAKVYNAMRDLQQKTTLFVEELNKSINEFETGIIDDQNCFKAHIDKIMHDYIAMLDEKIKMQDLVIEENITYIKENLSEGIEQIINEMKESGELEDIIASALTELSNEFDNMTNAFNQLTNDFNELENNFNILESQKPTYEYANEVLTFNNIGGVL